MKQTTSKYLSGKDKSALIQMKRIALIIIFFMIANTSFGQSNSDKFVDETLEYSMHYGWIDGGVATMSISETMINDDTLIYIKMDARSTGITDRLYKVRDIYESYVNPLTGLPVKAIRNISEGGDKYYNEVSFHNDSNHVSSQKSGIIEVPDSTFDILSAVYSLRNSAIHSSLEIDSIIRLETYFGDELFPLLLRYKGIETIKTELGKISCHNFSPVTEVGRVFKTEDDMTIWFSEDKNFIPVRVEFELFIGSLRCDLVSSSGLKHPLNIR